MTKLPRFWAFVIVAAIIFFFLYLYVIHPDPSYCASGFYTADGQCDNTMLP